jgi:hypothetical protein
VARLTEFLSDNAADLLFNFAAFIIVYLIARLLRANPLVAMCFAVLPPVLAYAFQHPSGSTSLLALLR